jgi:hypothetical protein
MRAQEFIAESKQEQWNWINKIYSQYPRNPMNPKQFVMVYGQGEDQQLAMFELEPSISKPNAVEVKWFQSYPHRQGVGTRAMKELQSLAAKDGITLTLYPWDKGQVSQRNLTKFYKGVGYNPVNKGGKTMSWTPEKPITEAAGTNILVVDVQPAHDSLAGGVVDGVAELLNKSTGTIYMLYNANGYTDDTKYDVVSYFIDNGLDQQVAQRIKYIEKEYGFFRAWMDHGVPDRIIIKTIRAMVQSRTNDSRMLDVNQVLTPEEQTVLQHSRIDWNNEGIYLPDFIQISILKKMSPFYMVGGGRNECLREIELWCNAFNIRYKRIDQLVYG